MTDTPTLSLSERRRARRRYLLFHAINGVSFACLGEAVLILFALEAGLPEYLVGALTALMFLSMPAMLLGKTLVYRFGSARTIATGWALRNACALLMAASPFFLRYGQWVGLGVLLAAAFGFFACRSTGLIGFPPLLSDFTEPHERGRVNSLAMMFIQAGWMVTLCVLVLVMHHWGGLPTFQGIILAGALVGFLSVPVIAGVPESSLPRRSAAEPLAKAFRELRDDSNLRKQIWASGAAIAGNMLVVAISMAALKKGYGVSDTMALIFTLVQFTGIIGLALLSSIISDHTGPRPLLILYSGVLLVICALWALAPATLYFGYVGLIFLLCGIVAGGIPMSLAHYFLVAVPNERHVTAGLFRNAVGGLASGLLATIVSAGTLRVLQDVGLDGLTLYRAYFTLLPLFLLFSIWTILRLEPLEEWRVRRVLGLFLNPGDLRALYAISRFEDTGKTEDDTRHIDTLEGTGSQLSETALLAFLESPDFGVRARALVALREIELSPAGEDALLAELRERPYTTAYLAAETLGERGVQRAIPALRAALDDADPYLAGKCLVALVRLGDDDSHDRIRQTLLTSENPRILIHAAMALADTGRTEYLVDLFTRALDAGLADMVRHELLYRAACLAGCGDTFYSFLKAWRRDPAVAWTNAAETLPATDVAGIVAALPEHLGDGPLAQLMARHGNDLPPELAVCLWYCATAS